MGTFSSLFTDRTVQERAVARAFEMGEALAENARIADMFAYSSAPKTTWLDTDDSTEINNALQNTARKLKALHLQTKQQHLAVAVTVGRGETAHVHEFHSHYNWKAHRVDFSFYDPESFIGRRRTLSPEISQWVTASVRLASNGKSKLSFMRLSVKGSAGQGFKPMHKIKDAATAFHKAGNIAPMRDTPLYYGLRLAATPSKVVGRTSTHHPLKAANHFARKAQLLRTLKYINTLVETNHLKPLDNDGRIARHCEPGASCTPVKTQGKSSALKALIPSALRRR